MTSTDTPYPFSALVGAEDLALALVLNALSPAIGGVLVRGEKGTAKSTAVRGLAALLPAVEVVAGCRFSCDPVLPDPGCPDGPHGADTPVQARPARLVELPVGASEDRVAGSLDLERALVEGRRAFEPGLLARAHRGLLYVDEVNLLGDHLVDLLLDAAAMGTNHVEREGVSVRHAARFQLVGTMNPEEGELRPQLLDRFGLTVEVRASRDPVLRAEVVRRRLAYEADPAAFAAAWADADAEVAARICAARTLLAQVVLGERALEAVVAACAAFDVDGLRADIVTAKAACALAAWSGRTEVCMEDVRAAALLALPHRRRRGPFESPGLDPEELDEALSEFEERPDGEGPDDDGGSPPCGQDSSRMRDESWPQGPTQLPVGTPFRPALLQLDRTSSAGPLGRRSPAQAERGHHVGDRSPRGRVTDVALAATIRAAAARGGRPLRLRAQDLREKVLQGREGNLVLFVVDASGSMAARRRMTAVKGAVCSLLLDAYQRRDRVGLVTFAGSGAQAPLAPTASVERAVRLLADLPTGGRTPIAAGLEKAAEVLAVEQVRDPCRRPLVVLLTDGRVTAGGDPAAAAAALAARGVSAVVVDTEDGQVRLGMAGALARIMNAPWLRLEELAADSLAGVVRTLTRRVA
ncbi:MAG: VWA domain-containing protein [Egibacteraceae bacterium]